MLNYSELSDLYKTYSITLTWGGGFVLIGQIWIPTYVQYWVIELSLKFGVERSLSKFGCAYSWFLSYIETVGLKLTKVFFWLVLSNSVRFGDLGWKMSFSLGQT